MAYTIAPAADAPQVAIALTPKQGLKFAAAITLFGAGMHYLVSGRKEASLDKMITGAVLALASLLFL
jgi:hypothetical protein